MKHAAVGLGLVPVTQLLVHHYESTQHDLTPWQFAVEPHQDLRSLCEARLQPEERGLPQQEAWSFALPIDASLNHVGGIGDSLGSEESFKGELLQVTADW